MQTMNFATASSRYGKPAPALTNDQLFQAAPSIFAAQPWHQMSDKYAFIPTVQVIDKLRDEGFVPVGAIQSRTRVAGKAEFTKHQIRFRQAGQELMKPVLGGIVPEVIVTNSHDGASAYEISGGLWRYICGNGLMTPAEILAAIKARHTGNADGVIEASFEVIDHMPRAIESVDNFAQLRLEAGEQRAFAAAALELRYDEGETPITPEQALLTRRREDAEPTLWNTFNKVQENLTQGGLRYRNPETRRRAKTRAVTGIAENTKLNRALWTLAEEMRKLRG